MAVENLEQSQREGLVHFKVCLCIRCQAFCLEKMDLIENSLISGGAEDGQIRHPVVGSGRPADYQTFIPPSTTMSTPVTYELSSEARNKATFATSSGRPRRPSSVLPSIAVAHSGSFSCSCV